jgi:hypothetical protein
MDDSAFAGGTRRGRCNEDVVTAENEAWQKVFGRSRHVRNFERIGAAWHSRIGEVDALEEARLSALRHDEKERAGSKCAGDDPSERHLGDDAKLGGFAGFDDEHARRLRRVPKRDVCTFAHHDDSVRAVAFEVNGLAAESKLAEDAWAP